MAKLPSLFSLRQPCPRADSCLISPSSLQVYSQPSSQRYSLSVFTDTFTEDVGRLRDFTLKKHKYLKIKCKDTLLLNHPHQFNILGYNLPTLCPHPTPVLFFPFLFQSPNSCFVFFYRLNLKKNNFKTKILKCVYY